MRVSRTTLIGAALAVAATTAGSLPATAASSDGAEVHHYGGCTSETSCWQEHVAYNAVTSPNGEVHAGGGTVLYEYSLDDGTQVRSHSAGGVVDMANTDSGQFVLTDHNSYTVQYRSGTESWGCHTVSFWHIANGKDQQPRDSKTTCH